MSARLLRCSACGTRYANPGPCVTPCPVCYWTPDDHVKVMRT